MKIENVHVYGFESALRGMRNPMNSWNRSDTAFDWALLTEGPDFSATRRGDANSIACPEMPRIGPKDMKLACKLIKAGSDHRKFLRQIMVWWDITIPRYIWQELDTYKVATVRNSCSTMHKLGRRDLEPSDFQDGDVDEFALGEQNMMGLAYREKQPYITEIMCEKKTFKGVDLLARMKRRLPEGFLQRATYSFSYETGLNMYRSRKDHRMKEWSGPGGICEWLMRLPYFKEFAEACQ